MKPILFLMGICLAVFSCTMNDPIVFDGAFVYIADENGNYSSTVDWESNAYLATYNINLVMPGMNGNVTVEYEIVAGDGLTEGSDYRLIPSTSSPVTFVKGVYKMPIRIEWMKHELDAQKDNTLKIILTDCSDDRIILGLPGPDQIGKEYIITKML